MAKVNIGKKWAEKVAESKGMMVIGPAELNADAKEFSLAFDEIKEKEKKFVADKEDFDHTNETFWYKLKKYFRDNNIVIGENLDEYTIGLNHDAMKDGVFVINLMPKMGGHRGSMEI